MAIDKQAVINRVKECLIKGNKLFKAKAMISKVVYVNNATSTVGKAVRMPDGEMYIRLSAHFLEKEFQWVLDEIIPHEVGHIIGFWLDDNGGHGSYDHDERWQEIAQALGSTGETKPEFPESYPHRDKYHYRSESGNDIYVSQDKHEAMQNEYRIFHDKRDGSKVLRRGWVRPEQKQAA